MSDPCVDLEKGNTGLKEEGLKEEDKGITGLKEEEKAVHQYKHLKVMCVKGIPDVYAVLFFVSAMIWALIFHRIKRAYIQHNKLASVEGDLSTALLASSKK